VLLMHGNTMNFYTGAPRFLPPRLTAMGYACLAYNRRGHDVLTTRASRQLEGGAFQTSSEGVQDNDRAAAFLAGRGFATPVVIGHSNGGMLAAHFAAGHPETRALVLLSAHAGGPRSDRPRVPNVLDAGGSPFLAGEGSEEALARARELVAGGRGRELLLLPGWWNVISAESLVDRADRTPDTVVAAERVRCPALFVRGDREPPDIYPAERFCDRCAGPCEVAVIEDCDHFYTGREEIVTDVVGGWLERVLG
jgi:pimeloyl-ACP methyl ester carboxylesterase